VDDVSHRKRALKGGGGGAVPFPDFPLYCSGRPPLYVISGPILLFTSVRSAYPRFLLLLLNKSFPCDRAEGCDIEEFSEEAAGDVGVQHQQ
jgi:hypothetical protein